MPQAPRAALGSIAWPNGATHDGLRVPQEHARLLRAFLAAAGAGDTSVLVELLAEDAVMISDGGEGGAAIGGFRNLPRPLVGRARIAAFVATATRRNGGWLRAEERQLNGRPAVVFFRDEAPFAALLLAVADGLIQRVFFHADAEKLRYLVGGPRLRPSLVV